MFDAIRRLQEKGVKPTIVFDIGAHHGLWTKEMKQLYPDCQYHLFEGIAYGELEAYKQQPNTRVHTVVLSDEKKEMDWYERRNTGDSLFREKTIHFDTCTILKKSTIDLESYVKECGICISDSDTLFMKIDCQGAELPILKGAGSLLKQMSVVVLEIPFFGEYNEGVPSFLEHIQWMDTNGFVPYDIADIHRIHGFTMQLDLVFVPKTHALTRVVQSSLQSARYPTKKVGFFVRHFLERGTEISVYEYAHYNEVLLKNESIIICFTQETQKNLWPFFTDRITYEKFKQRFRVVEIGSIDEIQSVIQTYGLQYFYTQTYGGYGDIYQFQNSSLWSSCKTVKHCVFDTTGPESDCYLSISSYLNDRNNTRVRVLPLIVDLPECKETLRKELGIPEDAIVYGRHGGYEQFDISFVHEAIKESLEKHPWLYFVFLNTKPLYQHPNIRYLERSTDRMYISKFIETCDAMLHGRSGGETFGLAIAEFSCKNKPVVTCAIGDLEHIRILGEKGIVYTSKSSLMKIFEESRERFSSKTDWNAYSAYSPKHVMKLFESYIL
jgi:FkbM family methyltransferase